MSVPVREHIHLAAIAPNQMYVKCAHCGAVQSINVPCDLDALDRQVRAFNGQHCTCEPQPEQQPSQVR